MYGWPDRGIYFLSSHLCLDPLGSGPLVLLVITSEWLEIVAFVASYFEHNEAHVQIFWHLLWNTKYFVMLELQLPLPSRRNSSHWQTNNFPTYYAFRFNTKSQLVKAKPLAWIFDYFTWLIQFSFPNLPSSAYRMLSNEVKEWLPWCKFHLARYSFLWEYQNSLSR